MFHSYTASFFKTILLSTFILSSQTFAADGAGSGGGGHFVFAADGSVTIADQYYHNQVVVPTPISKSLFTAVRAKAGRLGSVGLSALKGNQGTFQSLFSSTLYYFVDVIPQVADCDLKVNLHLTNGAKIDLAACTTGNHTFIKTSDWDLASTEVKLDLLIHERLREITGVNSEAVEGNIMTLVNASNLIDQIREKEAKQKFETLKLKEIQLLEAARLAVVNIMFYGHPPVDCKTSTTGASEVNSHLCYADTLNYGITPNGGGLMLRKYLSYLPESAYIGVGSILVGDGSIGENVKMINSAVFHNYWIQDGATLTNANIEGIGLITQNSSITNALLVGSNGRHTIDWSTEDFEQVGHPEVSGSLDGGPKYMLCYLDVANRGKNFKFVIPTDCRPSR